MEATKQNLNGTDSETWEDSSTGDVDALIEQMVAEKRATLQKDMGLEEEEVHQFEKPVERAFTKSQRPHTTLLVGGLTIKHEHLIHGALLGMGYKCENIPTPDVNAFQLGKEFGNNGQCNPTYFTVGNLVQYLQKLQENGMSKEDIIEKYVFVTAGACGPCRFGMYEAEYRLALRNSGFDGFRVLLFQQQGLDQSGEEAGLELNAQFFMRTVTATLFGDMLNDATYQIRPFEVVEGETDKVMWECLEELHEYFETLPTYKFEGKLARLAKAIPGIYKTAESIHMFRTQLFSRAATDKFREMGDRLNEIEVDRTRVKPIVKVTGEFLATSR